MSIIPLVDLGDRLVERLVPTAAAKAMPVGCAWQYRCNNFAWNCSSYVWLGTDRRRVCDGTGGTSYGPWKHLRCNC